ncbi:hypothetical protein AC26_4319 [Escherichia coli 1-176-05_S3_C2]|nr:hypothetical protein AC26_4319 [Escherichia coli 1-176-05_S3_C2]
MLAIKYIAGSKTVLMVRLTATVAVEFLDWQGKCPKGKYQGALLWYGGGKNPPL